MTECRCGRPTRDDRYSCDACSDELSKALGEVPWLVDELDVTITKRKGLDYSRVGGGSGGKREQPSPPEWGAAEARGTLRAVMVSWVRFCDEEQVRHQSHMVGLPDDDLKAMSRWLMWRVDGLALLDIGPEAVDEITSAVAHCRRLIDAPTERVYAGKCSAEVEGGICPVDLYAKPGAKQIVCKGCGTAWDVVERRAYLLAEAEEVLATATEISRAVSWLGTAPLTSARVRKWAERKRIIVRGHDIEGRPLYRVGDAIDLLSKSSGKGDAA